MENKSIQEQIDALDKKLDLILGYVHQQKLNANVVEDLVSDLSIIGKDAYDSTVEELDKRNIELEPSEITDLAVTFLRNIGNFKIAYCTIEVKLSNNAMKMGKPKEAFFKPSSSLGPMFSSKDTQASVVKEEFNVVKNLDAKKVKNFRIYMKYPPYMKAPGLKLTLNCH